MKVSIIIPVYNKEKYIRRCLDSILMQTYNNIEVIVVNDGSLDGSGDICNQYAENNPHLHVYHMANVGPGAARNFGMSKATGDYYFFVDGDDFWLSEKIINDAVLLLTESGADVMSFQRKEFFSDEELPVYKEGTLPREKVLGKRNDLALKTLLRKPADVFSSSVHAKAVKASFIKEHIIKFHEDVFYMEDVYFTAQIIKYAKVYDRYNRVVCAVRRSDPNSLTMQKTVKHRCVKNMLIVFDDICRFLVDDDFKQNDPLIHRQLLNFLSSPYAYALGMAAGALECCDNVYDKKEIIDDIRKMDRFSYLFKYSERLSVKVVGLISSILGINMTISVLRFTLKLYKRDKLSINN